LSSFSPRHTESDKSCYYAENRVGLDKEDTYLLLVEMAWNIFQLNMPYLHMFELDGQFVAWNISTEADLQ